MKQHLLVWQNGEPQSGISLSNLSQALNAEGSLIWLDIEGDPTEAHKLLMHTFGLSRLTVNTIGEEEERSKFVEGHNYFYLVMHGIAFDQQTEDAHMPKLDIVFSKHYLVTLHREPLSWIDKLRESARADTSAESPAKRGCAYLLYTVLAGLIDSYFPVLDDIDDVIDQLEDLTVSTTSNQVQARIFHIKREVARMRRVISPSVEVTNALITRTREYIPADTEAYFSDVHDHLIRAFEVLDSYRDLMSGLLDVYLTTVSNRLNVVMKQLTIIATIFLPITFVTGVFGQNFGHMPQVEHDNGLNFWLVLLLMAIITVGQLWYFKRRGWI
ncbi:MAG TPA: magnesium/cobalt transporter CorA [Ktedonobacterales bacterium]|nr:magnesium/cobalt transporter CorA [Ktedonobacterales bacterium]